jgi:hypothetical protein
MSAVFSPVQSVMVCSLASVVDGLAVCGVYSCCGCGCCRLSGRVVVCRGWLGCGGGE